MNLRTEILVIGAGIAGAAAAYHLSQRWDVLVVDRAGIGLGASGAAAGLVNPLPGRRARPVWRAREAIDSVDELIDIVGDEVRIGNKGILRPALDSAQARRFKESASLHSDLSVWMEASQIEERWPELRASYGALFVHRGKALMISELCRRLLQNVDVRSGWTLTDFEEEEQAIRARLTSDQGQIMVSANFMLLATGAEFSMLEKTHDLLLHGVKGQTISAELADPLPQDHPHVAGSGYIVAENERRIVLGSTYEHDFMDDKPTSEATAAILEKTSRLLPLIESARVLEAQAGVRATVPGTRLPMIGPLPRHHRAWIYSGLGTKGVLMASLLSRELSSWLKNPETIPDELQPRIKG